MSALAERNAAKERVRRRLREDFPYYAEKCLKIVNKAGETVPFVLNNAQRELDAKLEEQRAEGKPQRAIVLKARQVGISTYAQGKLIHRATLNANHNALVVAHDRETGSKLYRMGERMYSNLPDEDELRPDVRYHGRGRYMHFGERGSDAWQAGAIFPDSEYFVDTAGEFESGRGGTYRSVHLSELAFYPQISQKLKALNSAVPDLPDTLMVIESTANGMNEFKDLWEAAEQGRSGWTPHFWPWWKEDEYAMPFLNDAEHQFFATDLGTGPYGEDEPELAKLIHTAGYSRDQVLEKLNWRRRAIMDKFMGQIDSFRQEMPSTPDEAFLTTGDRVFDSGLVRRVLAMCEISDPQIPSAEMPGPMAGVIQPATTVKRGGRVGPVEVPAEPKFVPRSELGEFEMADWRFWTARSDDEESVLPVYEDRKLVIPERPYVVGADVSGGIPESGEGEPAYHTLQVIDHQTKEQVCEYRSRCDPDLFADYAYLTALLFNNAILAIEITGSWGLPIARRIWGDYRYPGIYMRRKHDAREDSQQNRLGWDTNRATKPVLLAGGQELLREGTHGIRSRELALEMLSYVKLPSGKTQPERGKFSDLLMAWLIAQQVALEEPLRRIRTGERRRAQMIRDPVTGYTATRLPR